MMTYYSRNVSGQAGNLASSGSLLHIEPIVIIFFSLHKRKCQEKSDGSETKHNNKMSNRIF